MPYCQTWHYFRSELDHIAEDFMTEFEWSYSPLRPEDEE